jgi:2TM domain-containing protein
MKFFNRYVGVYALIVLLLTLSYYYVAYRFWGDTPTGSSGMWMFFVYLFLIFLSAFIIGRKDEYQAYAGFNYHLTTYLIVNGLPVLLALLHVFSKDVISQVLFVMLCWGAGLLFHFAMYWFIFRKQTIKSYNKEDVFK